MRAMWLPNRRIEPRVRALIAFLALLIIVGSALYLDRGMSAIAVWRLNLGYLLLSSVTFSATLLLVVWLWSRLAQAFGFSLPFLTHLHYFNLSNLAKRIPGTLWYIAGRTYLYRRVGVEPARVVLASGVEIVVSILSNFVVSVLFAGHYLLGHLGEHTVTSFAIALLLLLSLVIIHPRVVALLVERLGKQKPVTVPSYGFLLSQVVFHSGVWILGGLMFYAICATITEVSVDNIGYVIGIWSVSSLLSSLILVLPANFGAKEITSSVLLTAIMPAPSAIASAALSRLLVIAYEVVWALAVTSLLKSPGDDDYSQRSIDVNSFLRYSPLRQAFGRKK